jgi:TPR repeat protein
MEILQSLGSRGDTTTLYRAGIAKFPSTLAVRVRYVYASAPQWGGGPQQLLGIIEQAKSLPEADRRYISALVDHQLGEVAEVTGDRAGAMQRYERAMTACPGLSESSRRLISVAGEGKDYARVVNASNYYIKRKPQDGWGYRSRGWAYGNMNKHAESFADFQKATQFGDVESFATLASFYEFGVGGAPKDPKKAIELYTIAQEKGVAGAQEKLQRARRMAGQK